MKSTKLVVGVMLLTAVSAVAYTQVSSIKIGAFTIIGGATRTVNSDDLLTTQQGDVRYARIGAPTPTPTPAASPIPTPLPAATPFKAVLTVAANGIASAAVPASMTVCVPYDRSGNTVQVVTPQPNLTLKAVGPTINLICY